jgi:uncharacterized RDD family membrane protein YckC
MKCPRCGLINPETAMRCDCGWDFATGIVKESYLGKEAMYPSNLASLGERFFGQVLDELIAAIPIIVGIILSVFSKSLGEIAILGALVIAALYILFSDGFSGGQSYGKRIMKIAVIDASSGQPCTFPKSLLRNLLLFLLGIIDWVFIFGKKRQRLGDMLANTMVVKVRT